MYQNKIYRIYIYSIFVIIYLDSWWESDIWYRGGKSLTTTFFDAGMIGPLFRDDELSLASGDGGE